MGAEALHRLMACNYQGVIKALVSLLIGKGPESSSKWVHPGECL